MRVAKNLLIDTYRHQQTARAANLPLHSHEVAMLASDATTFRTLLEREDMLQVIVETFQTLPEKYQRLLYWREIERLPLQEIALRTGTTEPLISTQLLRAPKLLQNKDHPPRFKNHLPPHRDTF